MSTMRIQRRGYENKQHGEERNMAEFMVAAVWGWDISHLNRSGNKTGNASIQMKLCFSFSSPIKISPVFKGSFSSTSLETH